MYLCSPKPEHVGLKQRIYFFVQVRNAIYGLQTSNSFTVDLAAGMEALVDDQYIDARGDRAIVNNVAVLIMGSRSANSVCHFFVSFNSVLVLKSQKDLPEY